MRKLNPKSMLWAFGVMTIFFSLPMLCVVTEWLKF
jgi:hypothetical protein